MGQGASHIFGEATQNVGRAPWDTGRCVVSELPLNLGQAMKQEQYKDLLREAEHHRLIKAATQSEPEPPQNTGRPRRRTLLDLARRLPRLGLIGHVRT
jgi:hypothetical protein